MSQELARKQAIDARLECLGQWSLALISSCAYYLVILYPIVKKDLSRFSQLPHYVKELFDFSCTSAGGLCSKHHLNIQLSNAILTSELCLFECWRWHISADIIEIYLGVRSLAIWIWMKPCNGTFGILWLSLTSPFKFNSCAVYTSHIFGWSWGVLSG